MTRNDNHILEKNLETLLETGGEAPKLADSARARIRAELVATHGRTVEATSAPTVLANPHTRRPLVAIGIGFAATAAVAVIALRFVSGPTATVDTGTQTGHTDEVSWVTDPSGGSVTMIGPRHARVEGAALVDVVPGKGRFTIDTARGTIEVVGTRFYVDADAERTTAAVVRGEVKLATASGDVVLHAGEQGVAEPGKAPTRAPAQRLSHLVSWAAEARRKDDQNATPVHHGTLFARDPGVRSHPPWGEEYPLPLAKLVVDIVVDHQVARVALDQTFHNDADQDLEGVYRFAIPPDAALQRLAMYVDGKLMESAVVERMQARRIYEELVYRRVDPALLEWAGTGRLNLRVYPLPARSDKRLMLAYTQSLPKLYDDWSLTVPLPEIDKPVGELDFSVRVKDCGNCEVTSTSHPIQVSRDGNDAVVAYKRASVTTGDSLVLHVRDPRHEPTVATKTDGSDRYLLVRAPAALDRADAHPYHPRSWVILDDVSASRGVAERKAQSDLVDAFMHELDENDRVSVIAFDVAARQKLPLTRVLDVDRRALKTSLASEGGVGATDFQAALEAATSALAAVAPDDAMIVYLGDGVITAGPRHLDELRAKIAGRARFIGVGVGDGPDTQTLDALAAATGGYATTIDLADDVSWRAFDLVAALHTSRVTGLDAKLVDATGKLVPATVYLASPQLADGEEVELVARLAGAGDVAAVDLVGTLDGAPWGRRIQLGAATADAEFLPRMWAQRHIAARLLAKHEPVSAMPCATDTWAGPCPTEAERRVQRDEGIRKEVVELGKKYFLLSRHTSLLVLENDDMYKQFGVAKGKGDMWATYAMPQTIPVDHHAIATSAPASDIPDDGELVRQGEVSFQRNIAVFGAVSSLRWHQPVGGFAGDQAGFELGAGGGWAEHETTREDERITEISGGLVGTAMTLEEGRMGKRAAFGQDFQLDGKFGGYGYGRFGGGGKGYFGYPSDPSYSDVTAFVPALLADDVDGWRRELEAGAGTHTIDAAARDLLAAARAHVATGVYRWNELEIAVDAARHIGWRRTTDTGLDETASYDGTTWVRRYTELGLDVTRAVGDDDIALALAYLPMWIAQPDHYAKWFDVTASGRRITLSRTVHGKAKVAFTIDFDDRDRVTAVTDGNGKTLVDISYSPVGPFMAHVAGERVQVGFTPQAIADATTWAHAAAASPVVVELPARRPAYWQAKLAAETEGSAGWRRIQRQRMVGLAATNDRTELARTYEALLAHGGVELGDLVLASGGIATATTNDQLGKDLAPLITGVPKSLPQCGVMGPPCLLGTRVVGGVEPALSRYILAGRIEHTRVTNPTGLVGSLWLLRDAAADLAVQHLAPAVDRVLAIDVRATKLRELGAAMIAQRWDMRPDDLARALDTLATGRVRNTLREQAAMIFYNRGLYDAAADRVATLVRDLDLDAPPPSLDWAPGVFQQSRRGIAGWQLVWSAWRDRVVAGTSFPHAMALLRLANQHPADLGVVVAKASALAGDDVGRKLAVAWQAANSGQPALAQTLVEPIAKATPSREALQLLAQVQLAQGRRVEALAALEAAQDAGSDERVGINIVRAELSQIIELARQLAVASSGAPRDAAVATAMKWGGRWRDLDPGNPAIDQMLGALQLAVGNNQEAWRQLSSVIERDPMSGDGYQIVANAFEQQGRVADSLEMWHMAIVIDQTNPTPRLRRAQALIALGKNDEGDAQLREIVNDHRWHDVWSGVVEQARQLLARGKQRQP